MAFQRVARAKGRYVSQKSLKWNKVSQISHSTWKEFYTIGLTEPKAWWPGKFKYRVCSLMEEVVSEDSHCARKWNAVLLHAGCLLHGARTALIILRTSYWHGCLALLISPMEVPCNTASSCGHGLPRAAELFWGMPPLSMVSLLWKCGIKRRCKTQGVSLKCSQN